MGVSLIDILPNLKDWDAYESLPNRSRIVVSTQIASHPDESGLRESERTAYICYSKGQCPALLSPAGQLFAVA